MNSIKKESIKVINDSKEFLSKHKNKYDIYSQIIDQMIFLTKESYPEAIQFINKHKDILFKDHSNALFFFKNIIHSAKENFRQFELNLDIIIEFSSDFRRLNITDDEIISPGMYINSLFYLYQKNFFTIESITKISTKNALIFTLFLPEITSYDPEYSKLREKNFLMNKLNKSDDQQLKEFFKFVKNNPEKHSIYRNLNYHPSPLHKAIREDDIKEFQMLISLNNFKLNHRFEFSYYERIETMDREPSLIDIAAVYGSLNIFKFLWMQKDFVADQDLLHYAYFGCNFDIIHICEEKCSESSVYRQPIFSHRYDLLNYYLDKYEEIKEEDKIKEKLENFDVDFDVDDVDFDFDENFELYQKLNYDALLFVLRGFNYVVLRKTFAKICYLIKFYDFENFYFINSGFSSFTLLNSCIYDKDMFEFFYGLKNQNNENENDNDNDNVDASIVVADNIMHEMISSKSNDMFKMLFYDCKDKINILSVFVDCIINNTDLANFILDYIIDENKSGSNNSIFDDLKSQIDNTFGTVLNLAIFNYDEDFAVKMVNLFELISIENADKFGMLLKNHISPRMASSLFKKLALTFPSNVLDIIIKNFNK